MSSKIKFYYYLGIIFILFMSCKKHNSKVQIDSGSNINKVLNEQILAWNKGDIKGFMQGYEKSDSLQFITRKGRTLGWQNVYDNYAKHYPTSREMGNLRFKNIKIKNLSEDISQVYGNWEIEKDTIIGGNFSLIMKNKPEGWKIVIDHTW